MKQEECYGLISEMLSGKVRTAAMFESFNRKLFHEVFEIIKADIILLQKNQESAIKGNEDHIKAISNTLNFVQTKLLYDFTDPYFRIFAGGWVHLIKNWNDNVLKDHNFSVSCDTVGRFLLDLKTMNETTEVLKAMVAKFEALRNWMPPGYEIAKHFVNAVDENPK